jgi:hypothetical protein
MQDTNDGEHPCTPPSPYQPWAPWSTNKRSFADALCSPTQENLQEPAEFTLAPKTEERSTEDDVLAKPFTFGNVFASGALPCATREPDSQSAATSLFGTGLSGAVASTSTGAGEPSLVAPHDIESDMKSISMRAIAGTRPAGPTGSEDTIFSGADRFVGR